MAAKKSPRARAGKKSAAPKTRAKRPATKRTRKARPVAAATATATEPAATDATGPRYASDGHRQLCELDASSNEVAKRIGVSGAVVRAYRRIENPKTPGAAVQQAIDRAFGIHRAAWGRRSGTGGKGAPKSGPRFSVPEEPSGDRLPTIDEVERWIALANDIRDRFENPDTPELERPTQSEAMKAGDQALRFLKLRKELLGDARSDEEKLATSPRWLAIKRTIAKTLARFPEASEALEEALEAQGLG